MYRTFKHFYLIELLVLLSGIQEVFSAVNIVGPPLNTVAKLGSNVRFTCDITGTYNTYFEWRQFRSADDFGRIVYYIVGTTYTNRSDFPQQKYMQDGDFGLRINSVALDDAASYRCIFQTENVFETAGLTVIDVPPRLTTTAIEMNVSSSTIFNCSVTFKAPYSATAGDQLPRLSLTIGGRAAGTQVDNSTLASGARSLTQLLNYTADAADTDAVVQCTVSTVNPVYTNSSSFTLRILTPPQLPVISPLKGIYRIGDTLTCSARGYPTPTVSWQAVSPSGGSVPPGPVLTVTSSMIGANTFKCVAVNALGNNEQTVSFTVQPLTTASTSTTTHSTPAGVVPDASESKGSDGGLSAGGKVGIGVGIGVGIPVIIAIILLAVFCSRRRAAPKTPSEPMRPPSYDNVARLPPNNFRQPPPSSGLNSAASTSPPPEYNPRPARQNAGGPGPTPAVRLSRVGSENSGYADLGLSTLGADRAIPQRYEGQSNAPSMDRSFGRTEVGPKVAVVGPEKGHANYSYDQSPQSPTKKKAPRVARKPDKPFKPVEMSGEAAVSGAPDAHPKKGKNRSGDMDRTGSPVFVVDDWPSSGANVNQNIPKVTMNLDRSFDGENTNQNLPKVTMNVDRPFEGERLPGHDGVIRPTPRPRSSGSDGVEKPGASIAADAPSGWPSRRGRKSGSFDEPEISIPVVEFTPPRAGNNRSFDGVAEPKFSAPNALLDRRIGDTSFDDQVGGPPFNVPNRGPAYNNIRGDVFADGMPAVQKVEPFTRRGDRSFEGVTDPTAVAPRTREPYNPRGDRSFEGFVEPPSAAVRNIEPVGQRGDRSFGSLQDPIGPTDPYNSRGDRLTGPVPASRYMDPYPNMDRSFDGFRDPQFSAAPSYNLESYPARNNRSFDNLHDTIGSVGSTAPLVRGSRDNLHDPMALGPAGYPAVRAGTEYTNDGRLRAADRSFDDNLSFTVASPRGSQHDVHGLPVIQFKNASKSVDV